MLVLDGIVTVLLCRTTVRGHKNYNTAAKCTDTVLFSTTRVMECTVTLPFKNLEGTVASAPRSTARAQYSTIYGHYSNCSFLVVLLPRGIKDSKSRKVYDWHSNLYS